MCDNQKFDDILFSMLRDCKTLPAFFDNIFGFLNRRTDFYCIATTPNSPIGLPEGFAENYVKQAFYKWKPKEKCDEINYNVPEAIKQEEVITTPINEYEINETELCNKRLNCNVEFTNSESYNGAKFENYSWSQTIKELDIIIKVPENTISKNLDVNIGPKTVAVKLKTDGTILIEGEFCHKCKHLDALWSLDKTKLEIHLEKTSEIWWDCLIKSEPKLDITKIDCSRPFDELSDEAQAKIEELTWNQERKRLGLPTTQEVLMQETLKKAWDAEGSPFSGPFNPNIVQYQ